LIFVKAEEKISDLSIKKYLIYEHLASQNENFDIYEKEDYEALVRKFDNF